MKYKAHDYQQYATDFIIGHPVSCLILDMGLGKTVITLTALWLLLFDYFEVRRILVIAPKRVAETMILSRLVDTFSSRILYPMLLLSGNHSIAVV